MALLALPSGPPVGRALRRVREAQALGLVSTREEALAWLLRAPGRDEDEDPGRAGRPDPDRADGGMTLTPEGLSGRVADLFTLDPVTAARLRAILFD